MTNSSIPPEQILPSLFRSNMLRMILTKHIELNKAADQKANILMTAASIVIAVMISGFGEDYAMVSMMVVLFSVLAIVFAILVIFPKPYHDREGESLNVLYFRSFRDLDEDEYVARFKELMLNKDAMYEQYMRDIYRYGDVTLSKKYRWLRWGLLCFLMGLVLGALSFAASLGGLI